VLGLIALGAVVGLCVGSFLGTLVLREPTGWRGILFGRSRCPHCDTQLRSADLIPLASWLAARGRCRYCDAPLSSFYPLVEIGAGAIGALAFGVAVAPFAIPAAVLGWWLLGLALIDLRSWRLPDVLTLPLIILGLAGAWLGLVPEIGPVAALLGAAGGYLVLAMLGWLYHRLRGRQGLGLGDAKLLAAAGAWLGPASLAWVILLAAPLGLFLAIARGTPLKGDSAVPFGPPLALAFWLLFLWRASY
jgi:leader peptidase (prepilin peptidase)/N-methyltransferase